MEGLEQEVVTTTTEEKQPEIASAGKVQRMPLGAQNNVPEEVQTVVKEIPEDKSEASVETKVEDVVVVDQKNETVEKKLSELSDDELREFYEKKFPKVQEKTAEVIEAEQRAYDKKIRDFYEERGGKNEDYVKLKEIAGLDSIELGKTRLIAELKEQGFDEEFIEETLKNKYAIGVTLESLEQNEEDGESDEEFEKRKNKVSNEIKLGQKALEKRGEQIKKEAAGVSQSLIEAIDYKESEEKKEMDFTAKVDEVSKTLPRKITSELGKLNDKDLGSVSIDVSEDTIAEITTSLKDPVIRKQLLYNSDESLNVDKIATLLLKEKMFDQAARDGYFTGSTAQANLFDKTFPHRNPQSLGTGGSLVRDINAGKGVVASAGKAQRVQNGRR